MTACAQPHNNIRKGIRVQLDKEHWYEQVETSHEGKVTILWTEQVQTERIIPSNPYSIIRDNDNANRCCNIGKAEKILKY